MGGLDLSSSTAWKGDPSQISIYTAEDVLKVSDDEGTFMVKGSNSIHHCLSSGTNSIDITPSCTCHDCVQWNMAVPAFLDSFPFLLSMKLGKLPESCQISAYLSNDTGALDTFFNDSPANITDDLQDGASKNTTPEMDHTSRFVLA